MHTWCDYVAELQCIPVALLTLSTNVNRLVSSHCSICWLALCPQKCGQNACCQSCCRTSCVAAAGVMSVKPLLVCCQEHGNNRSMLRFVFLWCITSTKCVYLMHCIQMAAGLCCEGAAAGAWNGTGGTSGRLLLPASRDQLHWAFSFCRGLWLHS